MKFLHSLIFKLICLPNPKLFSNAITQVKQLSRRFLSVHQKQHDFFNSSKEYADRYICQHFKNVLLIRADDFFLTFHIPNQVATPVLAGRMGWGYPQSWLGVPPTRKVLNILLEKILEGTTLTKL